MRVFHRFFCNAGANPPFNKFIRFTRLPNFLKFCSKSSSQSSFLKAIDKYMLSINTVTSGILMLAGDIANQEIEFYRLIHCPVGNCRYDWERAGIYIYIYMKTL